MELLDTSVWGRKKLASLRGWLAQGQAEGLFVMVRITSQPARWVAPRGTL